MRSADTEQSSLFCYAQTSDFVPFDHPLRRIRSLVDDALDSMNGTFTVSYSHTGRPGIVPERLIRALLLQILYSIRSERQLVEPRRYNLLFRWFVGLSLDDTVWDATTFTKNRQRFVDDQITGQLLDAVVEQARQRQLWSDQHFSVDGTLIDAWASMGSYRRQDDDSDLPNFKVETRRSDMHECKTDPDARLYKKAEGQPSWLCTMGHVLTDNRHALVVDAETTRASGTAEVDVALKMLDRRPGKRRLTVGADKNYDPQRFIKHCRRAKVTPHVAQNNANRGSASDARTTRHAAYAQSINDRHRVETPFGWGKFNRPLSQTMQRGLDRVASHVKLELASYKPGPDRSVGGGMTAAMQAK